MNAVFGSYTLVSQPKSFFLVGVQPVFSNARAQQFYSGKEFLHWFEADVFCS